MTITLTREEAQQVLDALLNYPITEGKAIQLLRAKLSEPEPEPVAWAVVDGNKIEHVSYTRANSESWLKYVATRKLVPVYIAPPQREECLRCGEVNPAEIHTCTPQREWVGLTDEEMFSIYGQNHEGAECSLGRLVEAKLKEKNT